MKRDSFFRLAFVAMLLVLGTAGMVAQSISGPGTSPLLPISPVSIQTYTLDFGDTPQQDIQWQITGANGSTMELLPEYRVRVTWQGTPGGSASLIALEDNEGNPGLEGILATVIIHFGCDEAGGPISLSGETRIGQSVNISLDNAPTDMPVTWELSRDGELPISIGSGQQFNYTFLSPLSAGTYTLEALATDLCGNITSFTIPVNLLTACNENAELEMIALEDEICLDDERVFRVTNGDIDDYTWTFSAGAVEVQDPGLVVGSMKVKFTGSGLQEIRGTPVNPACAAYPLVFSRVISAPITSVSGPDLTCQGLTKIYTVNGGASGGVTWSFPAGSGITKTDLNDEQTRVALKFDNTGVDIPITVSNAGSICVSGSHTFTVTVAPQVEKVNAVTYTHTSLSANNASPETKELTTNSCYDLYGDCGTVLGKVDTYVRFSLGEDNYFVETEDALASIEFNVEALDGEGNVLYQEDGIALSLNRLEPLKVYHFSLSDVTAAAVRTFRVSPLSNSYSVNAAIDAEQVSLDFYYEEERQVDAAHAVLELVSPVEATPLTGSFEHTFEWQVNTDDYVCDQVPGYQLQVMRIYGNGSTTLSELDWREATNIYSESAETNLMLSLAEGSGRYAWRVRPIGNLLGDTKYALSNPANWSDDAWVAGEFLFEQPDEEKNFIYTRTFTEKDRIREQLGYANGLGQVAQEQLKLHGQTDQIVAIQTLQDYAGRNALSTLPVPLQNISTLGYRNSLLTNGTDAFSKNDFDVNPENASTAEVYGNYYDGTKAGVASAEGVPYKRNLFTNDGTNRIKEQAGVGGTHSLTSDRANRRTLRTYYSSVDEGELVTIFGQEAPDAKDVYKIIIYDGNNVGRVTYQDKSGRIIATAIDAGAVAESVDKLDSNPLENGDGAQTVTGRVEGNTRRNAYSVSSQKPLFFTTPKEVTLNYSMTPAQVSDVCDQLCKSCDYLVEFILHNQDDADAASEILGSYSINGGSCGQDTWSLPEPDANGLTVSLAAETNYVLERRISTHQKTLVPVDPDNPDGPQKEVYFLDLYLGEISTTINSSIDALLPDLQDRLDSGDPEAVYAYVEAQGYVLDQVNDEYVIPVVYGTGDNACTEYIIIPHFDPCEGAPNGDCEVNEMSWEEYFADFWNEEGESYGSPVNGNLSYAYFDDLYARELELTASINESRPVNESAYRSYYAPGELDQMINNLLTVNADRLTCSDVWTIWKQEVFAYKSYVEFNPGSIPALSNFENDLIGRFFIGLEALLDQRKPEGSENICDTATDGSQTIMVRDKLYGKINDDIYAINAEYPNPKLYAFRLIYLNTDDINRKNLFRILANEDDPGVVVDETTPVSISDFNDMSACGKYKLYKLSAGAASAGEEGVNEEEARSKMLSECDEACEDRSEEFKQAVIGELLEINSAFVMQHHRIVFNETLQQYVAIYDETANTDDYDYSTCELEVMVNGLVENCKNNYCSLDFTSQDEAVVDANFEKLEKVFNHDFELQLNAEGVACVAGWDQVNTNGITAESSYSQLWKINNLDAECPAYAPVISTFDEEGNVYAVLTPRVGKYSYTLNNGEEIRDHTGDGKFAVVKYNASGDYLWHNEYHLDLGNPGAGTQNTSSSESAGGGSPVANSASPFEDMTLGVNSNGDVSFTTIMFSRGSRVGVNRAWKLMKGNSVVYEFDYDETILTNVCGETFWPTRMAASLSASGTEKWFKYNYSSLRFNTLDDAGNSYVVHYTDLPSIDKIDASGNVVWTTDAIQTDGSGSLGLGGAKVTRSASGEIYSYKVFNPITQRTLSSGGNVLGILPPGESTGVLTKFDVNGDLVWAWFHADAEVYHEIIARDDHVLFLEALNGDLDFRKVYSPTNVQLHSETGVPLLGHFNTRSLANNELLIYNKETVNDGISSMTVDLDDYSFSVGFDLTGSSGVNLSGTYFDFGGFKKYLANPYNDGSRLNSYTVSAGGYLAPATVLRQLACPITIDFPTGDPESGDLPQSVPSVKGGAAKLLNPTICFQWTDAKLGDITLLDDDIVYDPVLPSCEAAIIDEIRGSIESQKASLIRKKQSEFEEAYVSRCTAALGILNGDLATSSRAGFYDEFTIEYSVALHHYTLYYYDRAGNLISTVPPEGVVKLDVSGPDELEDARDLLPAHIFRTTYQYNSLNQLVSKQTPDAGNTDFIYSDVGQLRFSQTAQQAIDGVFSYTHYDNLSRVIEVGVAVGDFNTTARSNRNNTTWPETGTEVTHTVYNAPFDDLGNNALPIGYSQAFLRNRISYTYTDADGLDNPEIKDRVTTVYSYDPHGNVEWIIQNIPELGQKTIDYQYDMLGGNVSKVAYNKGNSDQFYHRYSYDQDNRLISVETSLNGVLWEQDATYRYFNHGPVEQTVLGQDQVQHIDYLYTINGWLKAINNPAISTSSEVMPTRDAYAMLLHYYSGDYVHDNGDLGSLHAVDGRNLYDGNVSAWENANQNKTGTWTRSGMQYTLDVLGRVKTSGFNVYRKETVDGPGEVAVDRFYNRKAFASDYTYDGNGNLLTLNRDDFDGERMDQLVYSLNAGTNRLSSVLDESSISSEKHLNDIEGTNSYQYDAVGNLIADQGRGINFEWTAEGKVKSATVSSQSNMRTDFIYDASGDRVIKKRTDDNGANNSDYYVRDASGNVVAIYKAETIGGNQEFVLTEIPLYGSKRLGMYKPDVAVADNPGTSGNSLEITGDYTISAWEGISSYYLSPTGSMSLTPGFDNAGQAFAITSGSPVNGNVYSRKLDDKLYELKDHLGNVRTTISDLKLKAPEGEEGFIPKVVNSLDYYPFGMDRTPVVWQEVEYLATFETDNEAEEVLAFQNRAEADIVSADIYNHTPDTPERDATNSELLEGEEGSFLGISKLLPVQAGDKVSMEVWGKYETSVSPNSFNVAGNLVGALLNRLPLTATELQAAGLQNSIDNEFANIGRAGISNTDGVSAYLNYLLFDKDFMFKSAGYQLLPDNADDGFKELTMEVVPEQDGYVYIYLTNESQQLTNVYFDDFKIVHEVLIKDPQLETYRYGYQSQEKDGETGYWNYRYRMHDPRLGRFFAVDPLTGLYPWNSPYAFSENRLLDAIELEGLEQYGLHPNWGWGNIESGFSMYFGGIVQAIEDWTNTTLSLTSSNTKTRTTAFETNNFSFKRVHKWDRTTNVNLSQYFYSRGHYGSYTTTSESSEESLTLKAKAGKGTVFEITTSSGEKFTAKIEKDLPKNAKIALEIEGTLKGDFTVKISGETFANGIPLVMELSASTNGDTSFDIGVGNGNNNVSIGVGVKDDNFSLGASLKGTIVIVDKEQGGGRLKITETEQQKINLNFLKSN